MSSLILSPRRTTLILASLLSFSAFAADTPATVAELTKDTRSKALPLLPQVMQTMQQAVVEQGVEGAIPVCKEKAPTLIQAKAKETGWQIRRVSLKTRNEKTGTADAWEARQLADFNIRAANGEKPDTLEVGEVVQDAQGKAYFRYIRAVPVAPVCLNCHGNPDSMEQGLKDQLAKQYPHDRATGYAIGQIRGGLSVKRPL